MVFKSLGTDLFNLSKNYKTINVLSQENSNHLQVLINDLNDLKATGDITTETLNDILNSTDSIDKNGNLTNYFESVAKGASDAKVNIVDAYAAILNGNTHGLKNVQSIFNTYNESLKDNEQGQKDFTKAVGQSNSSLSGYLKTVGKDGTASLKGYAGHLVKTTAKTIALELATAALNMAISVGVTLFVSSLVNGISSAINAYDIITVFNLSEIVFDFNNFIIKVYVLPF